MMPKSKTVVPILAERALIFSSMWRKGLYARLPDYLSKILDCVSGDCGDLIRYGLEDLLSSFQKRPLLFTLSSLKEDGVPELLTKLLNFLLQNCKKSEVQLVCAKILGMFGAIDPGHLPLKATIKNFDEMSHGPSIHTVDAHDILRLLKAARNSDIQDLMKDYNSASWEIYAQLNEADGAKGVFTMLPCQPSLWDLVMLHEITGQQEESLACYERLAIVEHGNANLKVQILEGMTGCYLSLDRPAMALMTAQQALLEEPECPSTFLEAQVECFWRMSRFEELESVLKNSNLQGQGSKISIATCLVDINRNACEKLNEDLRSARVTLTEAFTAISLKHCSYLHGYRHVVELQMLQEVEEAGKLIALLRSASEIDCEQAINDLIHLWAHRFDLVQEQRSIQESLLRLQRCLLQLASQSCIHAKNKARLQQELGLSWLKSAELARIAECYYQAGSYLLAAQEFNNENHFVELAKLHWAKQEHSAAVLILTRGLAQTFPNYRQLMKIADPTCLQMERKRCAEAKLLFAKYSHLSFHSTIDANIRNFKEAVEVYPFWEESLVTLGEYYASLKSDDKYRVFSLTYLLKSLRFGSSLLDRSVYKVLSLWLDFDHMSSGPKGLEHLDKMTKLIELYIDQNLVPMSSFVGATSLLIARMCHNIPKVTQVVRKILLAIAAQYPQQTLWMLLPACESSDVDLAEQASKVLGILDPGLVSNFLKLKQAMVRICQAKVPKGVNTSKISMICPDLKKILADPLFKVMVPFERHCRVSPAGLSSQDHPTLVQVEEEVVVLPSLRLPKKITLRGSDGIVYNVLCKYRDDLRIDTRAMQFSCTVNKYLQKDSNSRSRFLNIRTYSVVPLNESCGLIEWVPNLSTLKNCIIETEQKKVRPIDDETIAILHGSASLEDKRAEFNKLLKDHPPVLQKWFRKNFPDIRSWFEARKCFVRTAAVMSMVGYVLGLGDRHVQNILIDTNQGDIVHVDLNCLFNKGEKFTVRERVPFRLTQNMITAMGPTGVEGYFREACQITLALLRREENIFVATLEPFIYEPRQAYLEEEKIAHKREAAQSLSRVRNRLKGIVETQESCLSVVAHTNHLIQEAKSIDNLCQMYIGWSAYL